MALKRGEDESNLELNLMYEFQLNADIKFSPNHQLLGMVIYRRNSYQSYRIHILFKESNGTWSVVYHWANPVTLGISRSRGGMTRQVRGVAKWGRRYGEQRGKADTHLAPTGQCREPTKTERRQEGAKFQHPLGPFQLQLGSAGSPLKLSAGKRVPNSCTHWAHSSSSWAAQGAH